RRRPGEIRRLDLDRWPGFRRSPDGQRTFSRGLANHEAPDLGHDRDGPDDDRFVRRRRSDRRRTAARTIVDPGIQIHRSIKTATDGRPSVRHPSDADPFLRRSTYYGAGTV